MAKVRRSKRQTIVYVPEKPKGERRLATIEQACVYAAVSRSTLLRLVSEGKIKAYKSRRRLLFDLGSIDKYHRDLPEARAC